MFLKIKNEKGFTLIELLVVVSIVGLLSSIILQNLNAARLKARDSAVKAEVNQFRILIEQDFSDTGSYSNYQSVPDWYTEPNKCSIVLTDAGHFVGNYATRAKDICTNIVNNSADGGAGLNQRLFLGNGTDFNKNYSIAAFLPFKKTFYCIGSSGRSSDTGDNSFVAPGCPMNP